MNTYLTLFYTFKDKDYQNNLNKHLNNYKKLGFKDIFLYTEDCLPKDFEWLYKDFFQKHRRGYGYWAWKPLVIYDSMKKINDGDMILYHDVGRSCYPFEIRYDINNLAKYVKENHDGIGVAVGGFPHKQFCKRDAFYYMGCDEKACWDLPQLSATWSFWEKAELPKKFIMDWIKWSFHEKEIITDTPNKSGLPNLPTFDDNRHDQALLTNLLYLYGKDNPKIKPLRANGWEKDINNYIKKYDKELKLIIPEPIKPNNQLCNQKCSSINLKNKTLNIFKINNDFNKYSSEWIDAENYNEFIYNTFENETNNYDLLQKHVDIVSRYGLGYGEKAFRYLWLLIISQLPKNAKFLEIGVFKGSILALSQMISNSLNLNLISFGLTPLNNTGDKYSTYNKDDYEKAIAFLYEKLNLNMNNTKIIKGLSTDEKIKEKVLNEGPYDMIYIDGGHDYETVINDIELSDKILKINGFLIMDDASSFLNFKSNHKGFKGHQEVGLAIKDKIDKNLNYKHLFACGHNRVWIKLEKNNSNKNISNFLQKEILNSKIRNDTTIVTSHFNEDLTWLAQKDYMFKSIVVCDKNGGAIIPEQIKSKLDCLSCPNTENKGRETWAYLNYIVNNYNNLSERTAFIHGHENAWHYKNPLSILDAILVAKTNKYGYISLNIKHHPGFDYSPDRNYRYQRTAPLMTKYWQEYFYPYLGEIPKKFSHDCCGQFVVTKDRILKHPKEAYEKWFNLFEVLKDKEKDETSYGYIFEFIWHIIFGEDHVVPENQRDLAYFKERFL